MPPSQQKPLPVAAEITSQTFCASLHDRPVWAPVVPILLGAKTGPRWTEARLASHDLVVRMAPCQPQGSATPAADSIFRFLLVAPEDVGQPATAQRLQRLRQRKSSVGRAVVFLLSSGSGSGSGSMDAFQALQKDHMDLAVLPLTAMEALPATLLAFCGQWYGREKAAMVTPDQGQDRGCGLKMIRYAVANGPPLSDETASRLVAMAASQHGGGDADADTSPEGVAAFVFAAAQDEGGRTRLAEALGSRAEAVIMFWTAGRFASAA